jgi:AmmeMemoRadiSam system protein A
MPDPDHPLLDVARDALSAHLAGHDYTPPALDAPWDTARGVFVTWKRDGRLRGCIGHLGPTCPTLAEEVATCAVLAGTKDDRFESVTADELPVLDCSLSILTPPEPTTFDALDAKRYGVIVSDRDRPYRRGVLLPDLEGVDTPAEQIRICRRKGGIAADAPVTLQRFEIEAIP